MTADSKNKLVRAISAEELQGFLDELARTPGVDGPMIQDMAQERFGVEMGHNSANDFRKNVFGKYLERLAKRKQLAATIQQARDPGAGTTLADAAAEELSQMVFDFLTDEDGGLDLANGGDIKKANQIALIIARIRKGDRDMIDQLRDQLKEAEAREKATKDDLKNPQLSEAEREARMRARFGV